MPSLLMGGAGTSGASGAAFSPTDIAGLQVWYKADAGTSTTTDGVAISQWNDQSGNTRHLTQATGANQPLYKTASLNGLPVVRFDGSNDFFATANWQSTTTVTAFAVVRLAAATVLQHILVHAGAATWVSPFSRYYLRTAAGPTWEAEIEDAGAGNNLAQGGVPNTSAHVVAIDVQASAGGKLYLDGTLLATSVNTPAALTQSTLPLYVGAHQGTVAAGEYLNGDLGEVLVYSGISAGNRASVQSYLQTRWGTP